MDLLIAKVFNPQQVSSIIKLSKDAETRTLIVQEVGKQLLSSTAILPSPLDQLLAIAALAEFSTEEESAEIARIIHCHLTDLDVLPAVTTHHGRDLGERCLLGLSFFIQRMDRRTLRYNAPSPGFYRQVGKQTFRNEGLKDLAEHFTKWELFLGERLFAI